MAEQENAGNYAWIRATGVTAQEAGVRLQTAMAAVDWTLFDALYEQRRAQSRSLRRAERRANRPGRRWVQRLRARWAR